MFVVAFELGAEMAEAWLRLRLRQKRKEIARRRIFLFSVRLQPSALSRLLDGDEVQRICFLIETFILTLAVKCNQAIRINCRHYVLKTQSTSTIFLLNYFVGSLISMV